MKIEELLSTRERIMIIEYALYKTGEISTNRTAKEINVSKGLVSKFFGIMAKEGLLKRTGNKFLSLDNMRSRAIKLLLNMSRIDWNIFKKYEFVKSAGIYGSVAKGADTKESDIDIWIFIKKTSEERMARLSAELRKAYGNVSPLYLTDEKIRHLKKTDAVFYHSLIFGSMVIFGDGIEKI